ncbi:phosphatidylinositol N-acetylglucosaminyltransferase GPI19 [Sporobolomyces salmoneus]|uniref:phosphatidylinositol N-acetylglucosaminyltransferase GPI19 n=1 Tax=Sporobolomyces salmoneus TaxID=183962 RepID=UPI00317C6916
MPSRRRPPSIPAKLPQPHLSSRNAVNAVGTHQDDQLDDTHSAVTSQRPTSSVDGPVETVRRRPRTRRTSSAPALSPDRLEAPPSRQPSDTVDHVNRLSEMSPSKPVATDDLAVSQSRLFPPQYGRPVRPSSPDVFTALFHPVLRSLSRPSSPASSTRLSNPHSTAPIDDTQQRAPSSLPSHFPPRAPTDPAPTVESQGFVLYISSLLLYVLYLVWSFSPEVALEYIGIEWYPSREWALLLPSWITMTVLYVYIGYIFLNMSISVPSSESLASLSDPKSFIPPPPAPSSLLELLNLSPEAQNRIEANGKLSRLYLDSTALPPDMIPPLYDLPLDVVNRVLYE